MRPLFVLPFVAACAAGATPAETSAGRGEPRVFAGQLRFVEVEKSPLWLRAAGADDIASLPAPLEAGQRAFVGIISLRKAPAKLALIESGAGAFVYVKAGLEGPFAANDRHGFEKPTAESPQHYEAGDEVVAIDNPLPPGGFIDTYALRIVRSSSRQQALLGATSEQRALFVSNYMAEGTLELGGKPTLVRYAVDFAGSGEIVDQYIAVDTNGDGTLDTTSNRETAIKTSESHVPVFRIGTTYVSPKSFDKTKGTFAFVERQRADYKLFELEVGAALPDFTFLDVAGKRHRMSEWKGKHVLIHFWTSDCHPCKQEADRLKELDAKYRERGLEIVGFDPEEDLAAAKSFLEKHPAPWTEAVAGTPGNADVTRLVLERFGIRAYPSAILVDPSGHVLTMDRAQLPKLLEQKLAK